MKIKCDGCGKDIERYECVVAVNERNGHRNFCSRLCKALSTRCAPGHLTDNEMEVLRLAAKALTNQEIADTLGLSVRTVEWYMREILRTLRIKSGGYSGRMQACNLAMALGWIDPPERMEMVFDQGKGWIEESQAASERYARDSKPN